MNLLEKIKPWHFFILSVLIGIALASIQSTPGYMDSQYYFVGGLQIVRGNGLQEPYLWNYLDNPVGIPHPAFTYWMPLPSAFAAIGMWVAGKGSLFFARIPFIFLISFIPVISIGISRKLKADNKFVPLAGFLGLFPGFYWIYWTLPESFAFYMVFGGLFTLLAGIDLEKLGNNKKVLWWFTLGILAGLLHMARADGILWLIIGLVLVSIRSCEDRKCAWQKRIVTSIIACGILISGYFVISGAWYLRNLALFASFMPSGGSKTLWLLNYNETFIFPSNILTVNHLLSGGIGEIIINRLDALFSNLANFLGVQCSIFLIPLVTLGFLKTRSTFTSRFSLLVWLLIITVMSVFFPFAGARGGYFHSASALQAYIWALVPVGFDQFIHFGVRKRNWNFELSSKVFSIALVVLSLIFSIFVFYSRVIGGSIQNPAWNSESRRYEEIDQILRDLNVPDSARVIVINPPGYFLATGREALVTPDGDIETLKLVAEKYQACYLILEKDHVDGLNSLYISNNTDFDIKLLANYQTDTYIYQICNQP